VGTIIEIGSPRLVNGTLMGILYSKSIDNINLGHLADGLGYTAMSFVPIIVFVRFAGVYVMLEKKSTLLVTVRINKCINCKQWYILYTVKPVYKGHSREAENVPFISSCPLYTG